MAQRRQRGQLPGKRGGVVFTAPKQAGAPTRAAGGGCGRGAFYNGRMAFSSSQIDGPFLVSSIQSWALELGFSQIGVAGVDLSSAEPGLTRWLAEGFHGDMHYMAAHGLKRARPAELVPGTASVITARMDYLPRDTDDDWQAAEFDRLKRPGEAIVSMYARGRDYHKVLRARLQRLSDRIGAQIGPFGYRVFTDSAPVLEVELATRSGQGWRGKHTLVLNREAGSMFFLGEIYVDIALPTSAPVTEHCGSCNACIDVCPTRAIVAPHRLDARRCISYLTIEHAGVIPLELRPLMGNRIYGCDDCQLVCPWNKFAQRSALPDFDPREGLTGQQLVQLFAWTEDEFLRHTEGSAIRRIGHDRWLRNIAVALGNALKASNDPVVRAALRSRSGHESALVREHVEWALEQNFQAF
jgi:epoxyqueuosine reductase